ncbi:hypothetical protein [Sphingomonas sp. MMS24-J13]|uniref:hypothetical protein n=1 Tax=Sphingomonas sp. MMS24-J13 TaxID=3238686 RepID=UPI00384E62B7
MDDFTIARVVHVVAMTMWIGGVGFVTTVVMPAIRRRHAPAERLAAFHAFEGAFAGQARLWTLLAGASGLWMTWRADLWSRFIDPAFWWMDAMALLWLGFAVMLFVVEPLFLHRRMEDSANPAADFLRAEAMHRLALGIAIITVASAVAGSHGLI